MKPRSRQKHKGRREGGNFVMIPHAVQDSAAWAMASATAIKMLCDLARQYNGRNNGDLCAALTRAQAARVALARHGALGAAGAVALRLHRADAARRLAYAEPLRIDVAPHPRMRRQARMRAHACPTR